MSCLILGLPGNEDAASVIAGQLNAELGRVTVRRFPDGESYVRIDSPVRGAHVVLVCTLDRPDEKLLPLYFLAATARDLGAQSVGLVAPYLPYMRQDRRFLAGEGITAGTFAGLVSGFADWLVTVDPHLHRHQSLGEIYRIPTRVVHAAAPVAEWIHGNVEQPVIVGPDAESAQWVSAIAEAVGAPYVVLDKVRLGDRDVKVSLPDMTAAQDRTPVLVDDIISTAVTMTEAARELRRAQIPLPVCVGVHGVFAEGSLANLREAGMSQLVTCNTIPHPSNAIDLLGLVAEAVRELRPKLAA
ncbi:MAG: ribose-phosphate pyrophosphokinae [Armatimonadetes bacterium]|jgi:ribose-phosphate pyrophosphokinase|nr:ribose-phosphate pyrophosphokinae [Armatimonadota bacterium]